MSESNYEEIRRVRHEMSAQSGHDIRKLVEMINDMTKDQASRIISPGRSAETCYQPNLPSLKIPSNPSPSVAD
jgi:hypothetical protein